MRTKNGEDHQAYCRARNKVKSMIKKLKTEREDSICTDAKNNLRMFLCYVNFKNQSQGKHSQTLHRS